MRGATCAASGWIIWGISVETFSGGQSAMPQAPQVMSYVISLSLAIAMSLFPVEASATTCKCRQHNAEAEASGTCSRTEDKNSCTLTFTTTTPEEYRSFVDRLNSLGRDFGLAIMDPRNALEFASRNQPEQWRGGDLATALPVLFSISQRQDFLDATPRVFEAFKSHCNQISCSLIKDAFRIQGSETSIQFGRFDATVSYGCIELRDRC